ncbi:MAG: AmmeMemoRadiSam system protein B [Bacteroidetes bacterium]|nr:AmmeMemoRadiSam system protein B [Bacteroidota bacterium]
MSVTSPPYPLLVQGEGRLLRGVPSGKDRVRSFQMKLFSLFIFLLPMLATSQPIKLRSQLADTVGFAHQQWQMDSVMKRIEKEFGKKMADVWKEKNISAGDAWKVAISPHDDHTYASYLYPLVLRNVKAKTVIFFGVAHKAKQLNLQDKIIFDSFTHWRGCYGNIKVSPLREKIIAQLPKEIYEVNDSMQTIEHSVEGILPFVQYFNRSVEIVSILVPYNSFDNMNKMAKPLAAAIASVMKENKLEWGKDIALVLSTDAVHYGDEDWGGKNFATYGADSAGYEKAVAHEHEIIGNCFAGELTTEKIKKFTEYTVKKDDYKDYLWTWCGRYSVPMGLLTAFYMAEAGKTKLTGTPIGYATSLSHPPIPVEDLKMGTTAPAKIRHWVGYFSGGFK